MNEEATPSGLRDSTRTGAPGNSARKPGSPKNRLVSFAAWRLVAYLAAVKVTSQCRPRLPSSAPPLRLARAGLSGDSGWAAPSCCRNGSLCWPITGRSVSLIQFEPTRSLVPRSSSGGYRMPPRWRAAARIVWTVAAISPATWYPRPRARGLSIMSRPLVPGAGLPQVSQLLATSPRRPAWPTSRSGRYTRWWPMTATARPACRLRRRRTGRARVSGRPGPPVPQRAAGVVWPARQRACVAEPRGRRMSRPREIYQGCS